MIPLFTREEMRALDRSASEQFGVSSLVLMENAGLGATNHVMHRYGDCLGRVLIIGGEGQNGGDAWVVARQLLARGVRPSCVLVGDPARVSGDARSNLDALRALGIDVRALSEADGDVLRSSADEASLIVDGLFGTGLSRAVEGVHALAVQVMCGAAAPICALDLPSGIDANTGAVLGVATRAASTVTFAGLKRGLHQYPGVEHAGSIECVGIGVPAPTDGDVAVVEPSDVAALLPVDRGDVHKGTRGHVVVIAGSEGKTGASLLAAMAALRGGAGLVSVAADEPTQRTLEQKVIEVMTLRLDTSALLRSALSLAEGKASAVVGPGFGLSPERREVARALALQLPIPAVLDADALTALGTELGLLTGAAAARVLTPHPGEAARLLGCDTAAVQHDRYGASRELAARSGQVVVLKGARTVIAEPAGRARVCAAGTPALGVAGTGDVLSGLVAALLTRQPPFEAAWASVQLHAMAGELAACCDRGLLAGEVAAAIPRALSRARAAQRNSATVP